MKQILLALFGIIMLSSCSQTSIGSNPLLDGQEMMLQVMTELQNGNSDAANSVIGEYVEAYSNQDISNKTEFINGCSESYWNEMAANPTPEWSKFFEKMRPLMEWYISSGVSLQSLSNYTKLQSINEEVVKAGQN